MLNMVLKVMGLVSDWQCVNVEQEQEMDPNTTTPPTPIDTPYTYSIT